MAREVKPVEVRLLRGEGDSAREEKITLTPRFSPGVSAPADQMPIAIDELGVALPLFSEIERVVEGSPAAELGLQPGDEIVMAEVDFRDPDYRDKHLERYQKLVRFEGEDLKLNWWFIHDHLQSALPTAFLRLQVARGEKTLDFEVDPVISTRYFTEKRGLSLQPLTRIYQAEDAADAFQCGWRQVQYDSGRIFKILRQMVTGNVPMTAIGGIGTIAVGATSEAMSGTTRLLMFLTLLSVNLAILNFLPIPILDGGHMVFLAYEGVTGQPPNERIQEGLTMVGGLLLLGLIIFALGMDVWRISGLL
jgi:regulator of sigma E protease